MARRNHAAPIALGGVFAALAIVIMCMGGLIPVATFICPAVCILLLETVRQNCGRRIGWAWYGAVAILSLLLSPDKEAAAVFAFLGYYPLIKPFFDKWKIKWLLKIAYFNVVILTMYWLLMHLFGMAQIIEEFAEMGTVMILITLLMGNVTFVMLDLLLQIGIRRRPRHG
ncbi:MAG: hypothetical protein J6K03_02780 [Oscillospiraceae bacterium]|nr:hypothetical protein [Oscillospiraceae bacterium]